MTQRRSFDTLTSARVCWCTLVLAASALAASGCGVDLSLGELDPEPTPPLVEGDPSAAAPTYEDGIAPARIENPAVTWRLGSAHPNEPSNLSVGDLDGDGFDDMAMRVRDDANGVEFIHLRYGSPRPTNEIEALAFSESGARLIVRVVTAALGITVVGIYPAGDFDGDGFADLFVQTTSNDLTEGNGGYLLYGGPERLSGVHELQAVASHLDPGARSVKAPTAWYSFAAPGDIDGDGFDDLAMTKPETTALEPGVYVLYGRAQRLAVETPWSEAELRVAYPLLEPRLINVDFDDDGVVESTNLVPPQPVLSAGGDIDGDGLSELLVSYVNLNGAAGVDRRVIVIRGSARQTSPLNLLELEPQLTYPVEEPSIGVQSPWVRGLGDLDGDGKDEFTIGASPGDNHLFYGSPELLSGPIELSQASATLPGVDLLPAGDRDGDGDDDLIAMRGFEDENEPEWNQRYWATALTTVSGGRVRLSGEVTILPQPLWEDAHVYRAEWQRLAYAALSVGDLDGDGATELITLSRGTSTTEYTPFVEPLLHIHYGVHVPPVAPDSPY